ncbi:MAG: hypothetical protein ACYC61_14175 [Isosphaeraceae bacterium]
MRTSIFFDTSRPFRAAAPSLAILTIVALAPTPTVAQGLGGMSSQPIGLEYLQGGQPYPQGIAGTPGAPGPPAGVITRRSAAVIGQGAGMTGPVHGIGPRLPTYRGTSVMPAGRVARPGTTAATWPGSSRGKPASQPARGDALDDPASNRATPTHPARARSSTTVRRPAGSSFPVGSTVVGSTTVRRPGSAGSSFDGWHRGSPAASMLGDARAGARSGSGSTSTRSSNRGYGFVGW